jgi:hypothetical protein
MFSREHGFENFLLSRTEFLEAENPRERLFRLVDVRVHGVPVPQAFEFDLLKNRYIKRSRQAGYSVTLSNLSTNGVTNSSCNMVNCSRDGSLRVSGEMIFLTHLS